MRYAVVSDIHSNLEALTAVLERIDNEAPDRIICLGDVVGYYANPNECVKIMRQRNVQCIGGNHDRAAAGFKTPSYFSDPARRAIKWTRRHLTADNLRFLQTLPLLETIDQRFLAVHGALHPAPNGDVYLSSHSTILESFEALIRKARKVRLCFFGHTHRPAVYQYMDGRVRTLNQEEVTLAPGAYYLVNPGSVGQSRDLDPRGSFLIFDANEGIVRFHRVAYDSAACYQKARQTGLLGNEPALCKSSNGIVASIKNAKRSLREWSMHFLGG